MIVVGVALAGAEKIAAPSDECQLVRGAPRQPLLDIVGFLSVKPAEVGVIVEHALIVRHALHLLHQFDGNLFRRVWPGQVYRVNHSMLETGLRVPFLRVEREAGTVAPLVAKSIKACVCVSRPRFEVLTADDVHHATYGIRPVEG